MCSGKKALTGLPRRNRIEVKGYKVNSPSPLKITQLRIDPELKQQATHIPLLVLSRMVQGREAFYVLLVKQ